MMSKLKIGILFIAFVSCTPRQETTSVDYYSSQLFHDVQMAAIFPDSKTFVDCTPKEPLTSLMAKYDEQKAAPGFDLKAFVEANYDMPVRPVSHFSSDQSTTVEEHLTRLWPVLTRQKDAHHERSSLIPLPHEYIVPGGRFAEIYYWDSYFTMLGLKAQGRREIIQNMIDNFAFLIDSIGHIPNGNRNYYASRSQPPFFSLMVKLLDEGDLKTVVKYLPQMQKEYDFWMTDAESLQQVGDATERVVKLGDGIILNRYWDDSATPRPEAYKEDVRMKEVSGRAAEDIYVDLRAAAESGLDFCTRWFKPGEGLASTQTTDMVPPCLNSLMYHLELTLSEGYASEGNKDLSERYAGLAQRRKKAIVDLLWDSDKQFFVDYNFKEGKLTGITCLSGMYPFFCKVATPEQATLAATTLERDFLKPGGLVTTLTDSGEQWDAPNGWAPLQWVSYAGLRNYGKLELATEMKNRWLLLNTKIFHRTGKMMEKYNVMDTTLTAGGGEYPNQDGFGWTNGVWLAMTHDQ